MPSMSLKIVMCCDASTPLGAEKCMNSASARIKQLENKQEKFFRGRLGWVIMVGVMHVQHLCETAVTPDAIDHRLGRIEDEIKSIADALQHLTRVDERLKQHRDSIDDHEERLRYLEHLSQKQSGIVTAAERIGWIVVTVGLGVLQFFG